MEVDLLEGLASSELRAVMEELRLWRGSTSRAECLGLCCVELEAVEESLDWLSDTFPHIEEVALKPEHFGSGSERHIFEAVQGVLSGTVPDAALLELLRNSELAEVELAPFRSYLNEGDRESLYPAVWVFLDHYTARADRVGSQPWTCPSCGQQNEAADLSCGQCRALKPVGP